MKNKQFGLIGMAIPFLFLTGMIIYYTLFNINSFLRINEDPLILYTMEQLPGSLWMSNFNHIFVGLVMVVFMIFMIRKTNNSFSNSIGKWLLLASSLGWMLNGFVHFYSSDWDECSDIVLFLYLLVFGCGSIGFITLSSDFEAISSNQISKTSILFCGFLIIAEALAFFIIDIAIDPEFKYPKIIGKIVWLGYFSTFGIIGHSVATKPARIKAAT